MPSFLSALDTHLKAIQERDIEKFEPTVAENITTIDPFGMKVDGKKAFLDFHRTWFAQSDWERKDSILTTSASDSTGYALIQYQYVQKDKSGNILFQLHAYQVLIFENLDAGWQLVYDQNTGIEELNKKTDSRDIKE
jgi:ketosteroid isomerase-like protein